MVDKGFQLKPFQSRKSPPVILKSEWKKCDYTAAAPLDPKSSLQKANKSVNLTSNEIHLFGRKNSLLLTFKQMYDLSRLMIFAISHWLKKSGFAEEKKQ